MSLLAAVASLSMTVTCVLPAIAAPGADGGAYISLGSDADLTPSDLTFSMWVNPQEEMTGDNTKFAVWTAAVFLSACCAGLVSHRSRRKKGR